MRSKAKTAAYCLVVIFASGCGKHGPSTPQLPRSVPGLEDSKPVDRKLTAKADEYYFNFSEPKDAVMNRLRPAFAAAGWRESAGFFKKDFSGDPEYALCRVELYPGTHLTKSEDGWDTQKSPGCWAEVYFLRK